MSDQMTPSGLSCRRCSWSRLSFNASARTEHYTPSLHDALPISVAQSTRRRSVRKHVAEMSAAVAAMHFGARHPVAAIDGRPEDRKSTRLNSSHSQISYAVFCLKKKTEDARHDAIVVQDVTQCRL